MSRKPNLFIVGEAKCGTTALHDFLSQHPDIFMSPTKEPHFFMPFNTNTEKEYRFNFKDAKHEEYVGESSPDYIRSKSAIESIALFDPSAKIIVIFREPVDFMLSLHSQNVYNGYENRPFIHAVLASNQSKDPRMNYLQRACYADHLSYVFSNFNRRCVKIIVYEDFKQDNEGTVADIFRFLGLKPHSIICKKINVRKKVRSQSVRKLIHLACKVPGKNLIPQSMRNKIGIQLNEWNAIETKPPFLKPEFKDKLKKQISPEVHRLSKLSGIDFTRIWGYV